MKKEDCRVLVVGAGPAGILASGTAAKAGAQVTLLEKGAKIGRKLAITGKGRCNLTNSADINGFIQAFGKNGKFLYGAFSRFFRDELLGVLASESVVCKEERGGRIFPGTDRAQDVISALHNWLIKSGVKIKTGTKAVSVSVRNGKIYGVKIYGGEMQADAVVIATGGLSFPKTGSTGDGYKIASLLGHTVTELRPALSPLLTEEKWAKNLAGLALKNVMVKLIAVDTENEERVKSQEFGEMLFTHTGVSGPTILTLSRMVSELINTHKISLSIDLKPALSSEQLHEKLIKEFKQTMQFNNYMKTILPNLLAKQFVELLCIDAAKPVHHITQEERRQIVSLLKDFRMVVKSMAPIEEAIVTAGGIALSEVDPKTMMSKLVPGLFFAGEVMDIDARTGGYNLQAAFSTGFNAGTSAVQYIKNREKIDEDAH